MTSFNPNELLIWWVGESEAKVLLNLSGTDELNLPPYILTELKSIEGRPLRGRLRASVHLDGAQDVDLSEVFVAKADTTIEKLAGECGGIIIDPSDAKYCRCIGFVTDQQLRLVLPTETQPNREAGMLPEALVPHADEWYRVIERRFAVDKIKISGPLLCAIVEAISSRE